jgi:uncharacterized Fe-S center protein
LWLSSHSSFSPGCSAVSVSPGSHRDESPRGQSDHAAACVIIVSFFPSTLHVVPKF